MKSKILYVDDEFVNLRLFSLNFSNNYSVITAASGAEALEILADVNDIKIVVTDLRMPVMSGIELARRAKKLYPYITFVLLTGYSINQEVEEELESGVLSYYLSKPINRESLQNAFDETFSIKALEP